MLDLVTAFPSAQSLYEILIAARTAGNKNEGINRAELIRPVLDAIVGKPCNWNSTQCAVCFKKLLQEYIQSDSLELLLAIAGFIEKYAALSNATKRRTAYEKDRRNGIDERGSKALEKEENTALRNMANKMVEDYRGNNTRLIDTIASALTQQEIISLGIDDLLPNATEVDDRLAALKRTGKIYNIDIRSNDAFVGRKTAMNALKKGFNEGSFAQIIGGSRVQGKSVLALEYARQHIDEYQIVCWIDAWNEECILSSVIRFFIVAGIETDYLSTDQIRELFLDFFKVNAEKWLIIYDNANISVSAQKDMLENYMPSNPQGHILITANLFKALKGYQFYHLDDLIDSDDGALLMRHLMMTSKLDNEAEIIATQFNGDPLFLTFASSYIRQAKQMDSAAYLRLLSDYGCYMNDPYGGPFVFGAFDLLMRIVHIGKKCTDSLVYEATEQVLLMASLLGFCNMDLAFMGNEFSILPEPLNTVCAEPEMLKQLISTLRDFGIYEVAEGLLQFNSRGNSVASSHFDKLLIRDLCLRILEKMNIVVRQIQGNGNNEKLLMRAKPYIDRICAIASTMANLKELQEKYPKVWELSYCNEW